MTVDAPDWDPELTGHASVKIDGVVHAALTQFDSKSREFPRTECGLEPPRWKAKDVVPRRVWQYNVEFCPDCWPEHVVEGDP